jgi:hypothetical protein
MHHPDVRRPDDALRQIGLDGTAHMLPPPWRPSDLKVRLGVRRFKAGSSARSSLDDTGR